MNKDVPKHLVLICLDNSTEFFELGNYLHDKGIEVTYITRQMSNDEEIFENSKANFKIIRVPLKMKPVELIENTVNIFQQEVEKPDIIHSMNWISGACGYELSKMYKLRHIHSFYSLGRLSIKDRQNMKDEEIYRDNWELKIFESAEFLIVPYNYLREDFFKLYPKAFHKKVILIPIGVDLEIFKPRPWQQYERC